MSGLPGQMRSKFQTPNRLMRERFCDDVDLSKSRSLCEKIRYFIDFIIIQCLNGKEAV